MRLCTAVESLEDGRIVKACPWCGRNNLDSDEYCFNCERDLNAVPDEEESRELEREISRVRVHKPPSTVRLVLISLLRKAVLAMLAFGAFFIFALIAIWVSYDNSSVALAALAVLGVGLPIALYYPDIKLARRVGTRGMLISLLANTILLVVIVPPVLWFLSSRGYIAGMGDFLGKTWWAYPVFLVLGVVIAWIAGRRAPAETASP
jgi:hypothetical protein